MHPRAALRLRVAFAAHPKRAARCRVRLTGCTVSRGMRTGGVAAVVLASVGMGRRVLSIVQPADNLSMLRCRRLALMRPKTRRDRRLRRFLQGIRYPGRIAKRASRRVPERGHQFSDAFWH